MKKKIVIVFASIIFIIALFALFIFIYKNKLSNQVSMTTEITPKLIESLHKYPYFEKKPSLDFNQITEERPDQAAGIVKNIFEKFNLFDKNQKFITNEKLVYRTWHDHYVVRGILQTTLENGDITEQDVEYQYYYGGLDGPKYVFEEMRILSDKKVIKGSE